MGKIELRAYGSWVVTFEIIVAGAMLSIKVVHKALHNIEARSGIP